MIIKGRWAWALLIVMFLSLGANFFVLGFVASRWPLIRAFRGPPPIAGLLEDFPPELRRTIGRRLWQERDHIRADADAIRDKRREIATIFRAPEVDVEKARALMRDVRQLTLKLQERAQETLLNTVKELPADERARIGTPRGDRSPWR